MENTNPMKEIVNFYEGQVKEHDKKGYAETFKTCSERFFKSVNDYLSDNPVTFEDITYLDGYFIFGFGTNSVVHFHVKECPGWLFGIWWDEPQTTNDNKTRITGHFFAQYEEILDKFKPSRSEICTTLDTYIDCEFFFCSEASDYIDFIRNEPYLAFCRDYCCWNYNREYHTRGEAKQMFNKYKKHKETKDKYTAIYDKKIMDFVKETILPLFNDSEIIDHGECCSPRYSVVAPLKSNKDVVNEAGYYNWFEKDDEAGQETLKKFNELLKEAKNISDKYKFYYFEPVDPAIAFYEE